MFESGICGQLGFFFLPPSPRLIYTVCSETHQGVFVLGVCFGGRPRISALRVGSATSAAPGGPLGHKTSRGLLAQCLSSVHLPGPLFAGARQPRAAGSGGAHWVDFTFRMRAFGGGPRGGAVGGTDGKAGGTDMGTCDFSRRVWIPQGPLMKLARRGLAPGLGR